MSQNLSGACYNLSKPSSRYAGTSSSDCLLYYWQYQDGQDPDDARDSPQSSRLSPEEEAEKESDMSFIGVMDSIKNLSLHGIDGRYFGPASNLSFMNEAFLKVHGRQPGPTFSVKREHWRNWELHPVCIFLFWLDRKRSCNLSVGRSYRPF